MKIILNTAKLRDNTMAMTDDTSLKITKTGKVYPGCSKSEVILVENGQSKEKLHIKHEYPGQMWCELLTDEFYRTLGIDVSETQALEVNGELVRASKWIEGHIPSKEEFVQEINGGFIADCFLANWDVVAKLNNSIVEDKTGKLHRTDNGGALLFRACGERKDNFTSIVPELESMFHSYPELTEEEIFNQIKTLKEMLTDDLLDNKIDSTDLNAEDKQLLKNILKGRRDYIISHFNEPPSPIYIPDAGKEIEAALIKDEIDDGKLSAILPEWNHLIGDDGYDTNKINLGNETKQIIKAFTNSDGYNDLSREEKSLTLLALLFYSFGKPTGKVTDEVSEDLYFKERSVHKATAYMSMWGYSRNSILITNSIILNAGKDLRKISLPKMIREREDTEKKILKICGKLKFLYAI